MNGVVVGINIGHSSHDDSVRRIGRGIPELGFVEWHKQFYTPLLDKGFKRFERHLPFGASEKGPMDYCGWQRINALNLTGLNSDSWTTGSEWLLRQGARSIDYYGSASHDPEMVVELGNPCGWREKAFDAISPSLWAGAGIAFDATATLPQTHWVYDIIDHLHEQAVPVYTEGWPREDTTRAFDKGVWCHYRLWKPQIVEGNWKRAAKREQLTGEVLVACGADMNAVEEVVKAGHTPIIGPGAVDTYLERFK